MRATAVRDLILQAPIDIFEAIDRELTDRIPGLLDRTPDGSTLLQMAQEKGHQEIVEQFVALSRNW